MTISDITLGGRTSLHLHYVLLQVYVRIIMFALLVLADFVWLNDQVLVSCSKDGKIIQNLLSQADRPEEITV